MSGVKYFAKLLNWGTVCINLFKKLLIIVNGVLSIAHGQ